jgi:hypothetical protein
MKLYFGAHLFSELYDTEGMFASPDAPEHLFYYGVEYGSNPGGLDEVRIFDGCDRSIPVDMEALPAMVEALNRVYITYRALMIAKEMEEDAYSELNEQGLL